MYNVVRFTVISAAVAVTLKIVHKLFEIGAYHLDQNIIESLGDTTEQDEFILTLGISSSTIRAEITAESFEVMKLKPEETLNKNFKLLDKKEFEQIVQLKQMLASMQLSTPLKIELSTFNTLLEGYQTLLNKLTSPYEDELVLNCAVDSSILLIKQYKENENWYAVPMCSYVTDKNSILNWFQRQPIHPLIGDNINKPSYYEKKETRYRWLDLKEPAFELCSVPELMEGAEALRARMKLLQQRLDEFMTDKVKPGQQLFFTNSNRDVSVNDNGAGISLGMRLSVNTEEESH